MSLVLNHVGIVVTNIEEAGSLYRDLGLRPWSKGIITQPSMKMTQFRIGNNYLELLEPIESEDGPETPLIRFLKEKGEGIYHLSLFSDDFDNDIRNLKKRGYTLKKTQMGGDLFPGYTPRIAWLRPKETRGVLIEVCDAAGHPKDYLDRKI
jgi:methylmalonyl-CoA epimerase